MEFPGKKSVGDLFNDFKGRRNGFIKALTQEVDKFFRLCDPNSENLCLYALPNGMWEVSMPVEEVPSQLPEPVLGINFARDGMERKEWLSLVAAHCDSWLMAVAHYFGARFGFEKNERKKLFQMMNDLPTVFEVVNQWYKPLKNQSSNRSKNKSTKKRQPRKSEQKKAAKMPEEEGHKEQGRDDQEDQDTTLCGACGDDYDEDEFWICCDMCERWFHGACVNITPAKAELIKKYKCPSCSNKRAKI